MKDLIKIAVCVRDAKDAADANARCKGLPAYKKICADYPSARFERKHDSTELHPQSGMWMVQFAVWPKAAARSPGPSGT